MEVDLSDLTELPIVKNSNENLILCATVHRDVSQILDTYVSLPIKEAPFTDIV